MRSPCVRLSKYFKGKFCIFAAIIFATKYIGGKSAKYYLQHQKSLGRLNGYVEEMTEGQKVIKVFCHEAKAREQFKVFNDELNEAGAKANTYAFVLGPINNNLGYLQYVLVALVGVLFMAFVINTNTATMVITEEIICGIVCVRSWRIVSTSLV